MPIPDAPAARAAATLERRWITSVKDVGGIRQQQQEDAGPQPPHRAAASNHEQHRGQGDGGHRQGHIDAHPAQTGRGQLVEGNPPPTSTAMSSPLAENEEGRRLLR